MKYAVMIAAVAAAVCFGTVRPSEAKDVFRGEVVLLDSGSVMVKSWNVEKVFMTDPAPEVVWKDPSRKGPLEICQRVYVEYVAEKGKLRATKIVIEKESDCYQK